MAFCDHCIEQKTPAQREAKPWEPNKDFGIEVTECVGCDTTLARALPGHCLGCGAPDPLTVGVCVSCQDGHRLRMLNAISRLLDDPDVTMMLYMALRDLHLAVYHESTSHIERAVWHLERVMSSVDVPDRVRDTVVKLMENPTIEEWVERTRARWWP